MQELIDNITFEVTILTSKGNITLRSDGTSISESLDESTTTEDNIINYITSIKIIESLCEINNNPVGVVSSNTLNITLNSLNKLLIPENTESEYYGAMNNTARVQVNIDTGEDTTVDFKEFYVSTWISNTTSDNPYEVVIECTDLLSAIFNNTAPKDFIYSNNTDEIVSIVLDDLNDKADDNYKLNYYMEDIQAFDNVPAYNIFNIQANTMSDWLNTMCQCTLCNLYMQRNNHLKAINVLSTQAVNTVTTLSDQVNITKAIVSNGTLVNYNKVRVNFIDNTVEDISNLATISNITLTSRETTSLKNISLNGTTFKVTGISIDTDKKSGILSPIFEEIGVTYNKETIDIELFNGLEYDIKATINIYGQTLKQNISFIEKNISSLINGNSTLEVTNGLITQEWWQNYYAEQLAKLALQRQNTIKVTGFFNPHIQLGDIVNLDLTKSLNIQGKYRVIKLEWDVSKVLKGTITLEKWGDS